ncbi:UbiA family prenyltransferase [Metallosphaera javensis (ex Sakai et al. 2022)]|uniref:UbiA family prenyltransferase n=1 Tax=Metallosphaera javensis (ex Sakai et al. 2022) TaxID=2775498 RepID=UPI002585EF92|nr:MAG: digeranylgeranylglyceryl phosphate synthase [Metallosphaera javensis (ex Sakai et al. 2022)]
MNPLLRLVRIHNVIGAGLGAFTGYVASSMWRINPVELILAVLVVALVDAGGNAINDVYDVEIDRINKPDRPIPSGAVSIGTATSLSYGLMGAGVILSALQGYLQFLVAFLVSIALVFYARDLKRTGIYGNLIVATATALSLFYGGLSYHEGTWLQRIWIPVLYTFLLTLSREIVKGIEDYRGDLANHVNTLATTRGIVSAWRVARISLVLTEVTSPLPLFLGYNLLYGVLLVPFLYVTTKAVLAETSEAGASRARSLLKGSAFLGMMAFALGSLPFQFLFHNFP